FQGDRWCTFAPRLQASRGCRSCSDVSWAVSRCAPELPKLGMGARDHGATAAPPEARATGYPQSTRSELDRERQAAASISSGELAGRRERACFGFVPRIPAIHAAHARFTFVDESKRQCDVEHEEAREEAATRTRALERGVACGDRVEDGVARLLSEMQALVR